MKIYKIIIIAIKHRNGVIISHPFIVRNYEDIKKLKKGQYLIYIIDTLQESIMEVK